LGRIDIYGQKIKELQEQGKNELETTPGLTDEDQED